MCDLWLGFESPALTNWGCNANNVPIQPVCNWTGIACDSNNCGAVTDIGFVRNKLSGTLSPSLGQLTSLASFSILSGGNLRGTLPSTIGSLSNLSVLQVKSTAISGHIPLEFDKLTNLQYLDLSNNLISGTIPDLFYNLRSISTLFLGVNVFTGNVPPSICALTNVKALSFNGNSLSCYPTCVLNAPNPGNTLPVADPNALIPGGGGATYGSKTGSLTLLVASQKNLDPVGSNTCAGVIVIV